MDAQTGTLHTIARHLVLALEPLKAAVADLPAFRTMLYRLGWNVESLPPEYTALAARVGAALTALDALGDNPPPANVFDVLDKVKALYTAVRGITNAPAGVDPTVFLAEISEGLFDLLLLDYLIEVLPGLYSALLTLGVITREFTEETSTRPGVLLTRFHWEEVPKVLTDPSSIPTRVYGWGTDDVDFHRLAGHLLDIFVAADWPAYIGRLDRQLGEGFKDSPDDVTTSIEWGLKLPALMDNIGGEEIEVGIALLELPAQGGKPAGLILQPLLPVAIGTSFDLTDTLKLRVREGSDVGATFGVLLRPGDISVKFPLQAGATLPQAGFGATLRYSPESPTLLLGSPDKTRLELKGAATSFNLDFRSGQLELRLEAAPKDLKLVISTSDLDGFLGEMLGGQDVTVPLTLVVRWSSKTGIGFAGGAGFEVRVPINLRFGPMTLHEIQLGLSTTLKPGHDPDLIVDTGVSVSGQLGPLVVSVDNVGMRLVIRFANGNAGPFDIELGFKPPAGVGLKIDSPFVTGGGFLSFEKDQYAGAVLLNIEGGITVTAIGVIATKLPDHARGFSFVVMITAQGFKPIPLGLGFTLTAIGGLLAINRACNEEFLREGIQNNTLNNLLFPKDPIRNAPQIFGTLNKAFPPKIGSYLFGPVVQICWGTPPVLTMDLGLVLELGNKRRLIILGRVSAIMPSEKHDLIRLQMNALGVIDFDQKSISLDAILYDSRLIGKFPITGSMAMRLRWGSAPIFALSIGGFHPAFKPPPAFPVLKRLAISLSDTENFRLRIECYLAITSNTLQFGAKVELMARAGRFSIEGRLSFDVLIQFDPFFFQADFQARVQLKLHSHNLFSVDVKGQLSGPRPLHIKGKATFGIWWCHFSVRFDKTLVEGERPPQLEAINVLEQLIVALKDSRNWSGQLAEGERRAVILREVEGTVQVVLHPLDRLSVKQNVVPLELEISKFGNTTPSGARLFTINSLTLDGNVTQFSRVKDFFAPAQFLDLSEDEKLAAPSFEAMTAGIIVGAEGFLFTNNADILKDSNILEDDENGYETIIVDKEFEAENPKPRKSQRLFIIEAEFLDRNLSLGAAARSDIRRTGSAKYRFQPTGDESQSRPPAGKNLLDKKGWTIGSTEDGSHQGAPGLEAGRVVSYSESFQALQRLKRENPAKAKTLMLIRVSVN